MAYDALAGTQKEARYDYGSVVGNTQASKRYGATQVFNSLGQAGQYTTLCDSDNLRATARSIGLDTYPAVELIPHSGARP